MAEQLPPVFFGEKVVCYPHSLLLQILLLFLSRWDGLLNLDVIPLCQCFDGFGVGHILVLHQEADTVPLLPAAKALVSARLGEDRKRSRLLRVERAASEVPYAFLFQRNVIAHHIHDVAAVQYAVYGLLFNHRLP